MDRPEDSAIQGQEIAGNGSKQEASPGAKEGLSLLPTAGDPPVSLRRTLFAAILVGTSLFGDSYLYTVLPVHYAAAGINLVGVGWVLSANRWVRLFTNPVAGTLGARLGWSGAFALALWVGAATTAAYGLWQGLALFLFARCLWGFCWSFLRLGGTAAILADSPPGRRGRLMGLFTGVFRLGSLVATLLGGFLADRWGFAATALFLAAASALGALVGSLPPALAGRWGAPARDGVPAPATGALHRHWLPVGGAEWAACLSIAAAQFVVSGLITATLGLLIHQRFGLSIPIGGRVVGAAGLTGLILGARWAIDLVLAPAAGHWADTRGRQAVLALTTLLTMAGLLALGYLPSLALTIAASLLVFVAATAMSTAIDAWAGDLAGHAPGRFLPAYNTWTDFGAAAGPIVGYYLIAAAGLPLTYAGGALTLALAWLVRARWSGAPA